MHAGPIRSIVLDFAVAEGGCLDGYDNIMIYSGGMDGRVCISGVSVD